MSQLGQGQGYVGILDLADLAGFGDSYVVEYHFCPDHPHPDHKPVHVMTREELIEEGDGYLVDRNAELPTLMYHVQMMRNGALDRLPVQEAAEAS